MEKTAVTVTFCVQIGMETWRDIHNTKVFEETATLKEILGWAKTIDKTSTISTLAFGDVSE